jgi:hypothetical protein
MCTMKRSQRWSADSDEGPGNRVSPTGPFRRRRALRHLDSLAQHPVRELNPAVAHVRVIGDADRDDSRHRPGALTRPLREVGSTVVPSPVPLSPVPTPAGEDIRIVRAQPGEQLHAVPIDEPLGASR